MQINMVTLPNGQTAVEIDDEIPDGLVKEIGDFKKPISDIPQNLIDECEMIADKKQKTMFIFDTATRTLINSLKKDITTQEKRDIIIDELIDDSDYYIGDMDEFYEMPSRNAYYDTDSKIVGTLGRYDRAMEFIHSLGFEPGFANYGREMEQSFFINKPKIILRVKPNLSITMSYHGEDGEMSMNGNFNKIDIYNFLHTIPDNDLLPFLRESKINNILD